MAGKTKSMSQIKQLLLLKKQNVSNRKAATQVGMDKETVNNYVRKALADPLGIDGLLKLDDPVLEHRLKGGNAAYPDERFEEFKALLPYLEEEMSKSRKTHVLMAMVLPSFAITTIRTLRHPRRKRHLPSSQTCMWEAKKSFWTILVTH